MASSSLVDKRLETLSGRPPEPTSCLCPNWKRFPFHQSVPSWQMEPKLYLAAMCPLSRPPWAVDSPHNLPWRPCCQASHRLKQTEGRPCDLMTIFHWPRGTGGTSSGGEGTLLLLQSTSTQALREVFCTAAGMHGEQRAFSGTERGVIRVTGFGGFMDYNTTRGSTRCFTRRCGDRRGCPGAPSFVQGCVDRRQSVGLAFLRLWHPF